MMVRKILDGVSDHVSACLQLAILLEASAYPKPGNVHRTVDFQQTKYEHYLASAVAVAPHFRLAAKQGISVINDEISSKDIEVGRIIKDCIKSVDEWQHGGNTVLGAIILLSPIAVAGGMTSTETSFSIDRLKENIRIVVENTSALDAVNVYDAIQIAKPEGLGKVPRYDINDPGSKIRILEDNITLLDVFRIASEYDTVAAEWVNGYSITFDLGYPYFAKKITETDSVNSATLYTFLKILSEIPDTFIARKVGLPKAEEISARAKQILETIDLSTPEGKRMLWRFDEELRDHTNKLNPGTTADIITAVLAINILKGFRP